MNEFLEKIFAKIKLGIELSDYEHGMWVLYGDPNIKI